jgi:hypothetical protein
MGLDGRVISVNRMLTDGRRSRGIDRILKKTERDSRFVDAQHDGVRTWGIAMPSPTPVEPRLSRASRISNRKLRSVFGEFQQTDDRAQHGGWICAADPVGHAAALSASSRSDAGFSLIRPR